MYFEILKDYGIHTANSNLFIDLKILPILSHYSIEENWKLIESSPFGAIIFNDNTDVYNIIRSSLTFVPINEILINSNQAKTSIKISSFHFENEDFRLLFEFPPSLFWKLV